MAIGVIQEGLAYESNYGSGLRVVDVSSVTTDPTGGHFKEVAFFDGLSSLLISNLDLQAHVYIVVLYSTPGRRRCRWHCRVQWVVVSIPILHERVYSRELDRARAFRCQDERVSDSRRTIFGFLQTVIANTE